MPILLLMYGTHCLTVYLKIMSLIINKEFYYVDFALSTMGLLFLDNIYID
jgi:hypothetical protein